jgi:hypothetical protein
LSGRYHRGVTRTSTTFALAAALVGCIGDESLSPVPGEGGGTAAVTTAATGAVQTSSASTTTSGPAGGGSPSAGGAPGEGGAGGGEGGEGGAGGDGGGWNHGGGGCHPMSPDDLEIVALESGVTATYRAELDDEVGSPGHDAFFFEVYGAAFGAGYDGEATGVFDLSRGADANYGSCSRCFLAGDASVGLFQEAGTLTIDAASTHLGDGALLATVTGLVLVESVFDPDTGESTKVEDGACLTLDRLEMIVPVSDVPPGWHCPDRDYAAGDGCDCNCGGYDTDCDDPEQAIYFCGTPHYPGDGPACLSDGRCENESGEWLCDEFWYGDGECDCGCGIQDFDCESTEEDFECQYCTFCEPSAGEYACFGIVDPDDTTRCDR